MIIGISCILFSAMAFGVSGFYFSQGFKVGDICEQVQYFLLSCQNFDFILRIPK